MIIELDFILENVLIIGVLLITVFLVIYSINVLALRLFYKDWKVSLYAGALLLQIGEFSFILGPLGFSSGIIEDYGYQLIISTIALSLFLSPFWKSLTRKTVGKILNGNSTRLT